MIDEREDHEAFSAMCLRQSAHLATNGYREPNLPLINKIMDHVLAHPETHRQASYAVKSECGTAYCFAGHAVHMSGDRAGCARHLRVAG